MRLTLNTTIKPLIKQALQEKPTGDDWLDARYDEQALPPVGHTQPYYRLFYLLAQKLKPVTVVELGGWQGTAAAHFAAGAPEAKVITIDHHSDPGDEFNQAKMLDVVRQYPNVNYLQGWTTPGYEEEHHKGAVSVFEDVKQILGADKIDILFVDSWHEGRYLKRDVDHYFPLLASSALVIVDDVFDSEHFVDMIATFNALPGEKFINDQVHSGIPMGFIKHEAEKSSRKKRTYKRRKTGTESN